MEHLAVNGVPVAAALLLFRSRGVIRDRRRPRCGLLALLRLRRLPVAQGGADRRELAVLASAARGNVLMADPPRGAQLAQRLREGVAGPLEVGRASLRVRGGVEGALV